MILSIWTSPKTGQVRVYINSSRYNRADEYRAGISDADGAYFFADENGKIAYWFQSSYSGRFGEAVFEFMRLYEITREMDFSALVSRVENAKGPKGAIFSERVYFNNLSKETGNEEIEKKYP